MSLRNPVKYPVKYYSWQDTQAPQLSNADGVIKTILKACLVTGYGSKAGAGWTSLFEDAYRIVLRRPLRTGNPPDIKIENGTITGTTVRHRIVAQDNPTGLDDANELSAVNLVSKGSVGQQWHMLVTDFAFILIYDIGSGLPSRSILYVGSAQKLKDVEQDYFVATSQTINTNGTMSNYTTLWSSIYYFTDLRAKINYGVKNVLTIDMGETEINDDYFIQKIIMGKNFIMPFYCTFRQGNSVSSFDTTTKTVRINNRDMLRCIDFNNNANIFRPIFIPLDYWEL